MCLFLIPVGSGICLSAIFNIDDRGLFDRAVGFVMGALVAAWGISALRAGYAALVSYWAPGQSGPKAFVLLWVRQVSWLTILSALPFALLALEVGLYWSRKINFLGVSPMFFEELLEVEVLRDS